MGIKWQEIAENVANQLLSSSISDLSKVENETTERDFKLSFPNSFTIFIKDNSKRDNSKYKWVWECKLPDYLSDHWKNNSQSLLKDDFFYYYRDDVVWLKTRGAHYDKFIETCEDVANSKVPADTLSKVIVEIIKAAYNILISRGKRYLKLISLKVSNFRSYKEDSVIYFDRLTTLIGENDSGKTSLLLAIFYYLKALKLLSNSDSTIRTELPEDFFKPLKRRIPALLAKSLFNDLTEPIELSGTLSFIKSINDLPEAINKEMQLTIRFYYQTETNNFEIELNKNQNLEQTVGAFKYINPIYLDSTVKSDPLEEKERDENIIKEKLLEAKHDSIFKNLLNKTADGLKSNEFLKVLDIEDIQQSDSDEGFINLELCKSNSLYFSIDDIGQGYKDLLLCLSVTTFLSPLGSSFLLIDEQGLHLHPLMKIKFAEILQKIAESYENMQIIYATHDPKLIPYNSDSLSIAKIEKKGKFSSVDRIAEVEDAYRFLETAGYFEIVSQYAKKIRDSKKVMFVEGGSDKKYLNLIFDYLNKYPDLQVPNFLPPDFKDYTIISIQGVESIPATGSILIAIPYILGGKIFKEMKSFIRELFERCWIILDADYSIFDNDRKEYCKIVSEDITKVYPHYIKNNIELNIKVLDCYAIENLFLANKYMRKALCKLKNTTEMKVKERISRLIKIKQQQIENNIKEDYERKEINLSAEEIEKRMKYCAKNPFRRLNPKKYVIPSVFFNDEELFPKNNECKEKEISNISNELLRSVKAILKNFEHEESLSLFFNELT